MRDGNEYRELTRNLSHAISGLRRDKPDVMQGFSAMASAAMADGVLERKQKELMALAIGVATHCKGCIGFHTKALLSLDVSREEFEEALGVAIYMGGGPSLMYAAEAMRAFEELAEEQ